jgi:enamine deaminase RidA (YjgF/YER057c/UK114 family)
MPIRHGLMSRPVQGEPTPLAHRAVVHGDTIYLAGMVADDKSLSVGGQMTQILEKIAAVLKTLNSDASRLLFVMIYLTDMKGKDEMNAAWTAFFEPEDLPARATVGVAQLGPKTLVEVVATAVAGAKVV